MKSMHSFKLKLIGFLMLMAFFVTPEPSNAQCAMCSLNAENSVQDGNTQGKGLNTGVLFLLSMPFIFGIGIGYLWYKKFRQQPSKNGMTFSEGAE